MELKGSKTEADLLEAFAGRKHGPEQVHLLRQPRPQGRL